MQSFENAFNQLDQWLTPRLSQIQEYCQSIEELELERIQKVRKRNQRLTTTLSRINILKTSNQVCYFLNNLIFAYLLSF